MPYHADPWLTVYQGDCREVMAAMEPESVHCVVTSPPYWGLRDYGTATWIGGDEGCDHVREARKYADGCIGCGVPMQETTVGCRQCADRHWRRRENGTSPERQYGGEPSDSAVRWRDRDNIGYQKSGYTCVKCGAVRQDSQLGLELTPEEYVANMVDVFRAVRRVLRADGTVWLNLGDSYAAGPMTEREKAGERSGGTLNGRYGNVDNVAAAQRRSPVPSGLKPKDLVGIPWRVAFALQADGWYLRSDIIWSKPNPMPESVTDRPTKAHEYLFLLSKSPRYYYDADAVREDQAAESIAAYERARATPREPADWKRNAAVAHMGAGATASPNAAWSDPEKLDRFLARGRNLRSVWSIATQPYPGAHFATFPEALVEPCVKAGTSEKGVCPECGAPWVREAVETAEYAEFKAKMRAQNYSQVREGERGGRTNPATVPQKSTTTGWRCSCAHDAIPVPAVVLDPFAGSGTTGRVAQRLGRRAVLIDLSGEYLTQAMTRNADIPLGLETA